MRHPLIITIVSALSLTCCSSQRKQQVGEELHEADTVQVHQKVIPMDGFAIKR